jgi:hypothetical protein
MDGRVLSELLIAGSQNVDERVLPATAHERAQYVLSQDEDAELQARLKGFGYLG